MKIKFLAVLTCVLFLFLNFIPEARTGASSGIAVTVTMETIGTTPITGSIIINNGDPFTASPDVTLTLQASSNAQIQGDWNGDGSVDAADYVVWRKMGGSQADYDAWRSNFGKTKAITQMSFSNDGVTFSAPEPYQTTKGWTLSPGDGEKTVYVKFFDGAGNESNLFLDTITLDTTPP
jgi:hypothetical protein